MLSGTACRFSDRFWAVTTISARAGASSELALAARAALAGRATRAHTIKGLVSRQSFMAGAPVTACIDIDVSINHDLGNGQVGRGARRPAAPPPAAVAAAAAVAKLV